MSRELDELELGISKLKNENRESKRIISELMDEKSRLVEKSNYLSQKLKEAYTVYEEAGKRILDFVDGEIKPARSQLVLLKGQIDELRKKTSEHDSQINDIMGKRLEKIQDEFNRVLKEINEKLQSERKQDLSSQFKEFKKELERITSLEKELKVHEKHEEARLSDIVKQQLSSLDKQRLDLQNTVNQFRSEVESKRKEDFQTQFKEFKKELDRISQLSTQVKNLEKRQTSKSLDIYDNIASLRRRLGDQENKLDHIFQQEVESLAELKKEMNEKVAQLHGIVNSLNSENIREDMKRFSEELKKMEEYEKRLDTMKKLHERSLQEALDSLAVVRTKIEALEESNESKLSDYGKALSELQRDINRKVASLKKELEESRKSSFNEQIKEFRDNAKKLLGLEKQMNEFSKRHGSDFSKLNEEISLLKNVTNEQELKLGGFSEEFKKTLSGMRGELNEKLNSLKKELQDVRVSEFNEQVKEFKDTTKKLINLEKQIDSINKSNSSELSKLNGEISLLKNLADQQESEITTISDEWRRALMQTKEEFMEKLASLRKETQENKHSDIRDSMKQFRKEMEKLATLEQEIQKVDRKQEISSTDLLNEVEKARKLGQNELQNQVKRFDRSITELEKSLLSLEKRINIDDTKLEKSIINALSDEKVLKSAQDNVRKWLESEVQKQNKILKESLGSMEKSLNEFSSDIRELSRNLSMERQKISELESEKNSIDQQIEGLEKKIAGLESSLKKSADRIWSELNVKTQNELESVRKMAQSEIKEVSREIGKLESSKLNTKDFQNEANSIKSEMNELGLLLDTVEKRIKNQINSDRKAVDYKLDNMEKKISDLESSLKKSADRIWSELNVKTQNEMKSIHNLAEKDIKNLSDELLDVDKRKINTDDFNREMDNLNNSINDLSAQLEADRKSFEDKLEDVKKDVMGMEKKIGRESDRIWSDLNTKLSSEFSAFQSSYQKEINRINQSLQNLDGSKLGQESFDQKISEVNATIDSINKRIDELRGELEKDSDQIWGRLSSKMKNEVNNIKEAAYSDIKEIFREIKELKLDKLGKDGFAEGVDSLNKKINELKLFGARIKKLEDRLSSLDEELRGQESLNSVYSQDINSLRSQLKTIESFGKELKTDVMVLEEKLKTKESDIDSMLSQQKTDINNMKLELHQSLIDMEKKLQAKKYDSEQKLAQLRKELNGVSGLEKDVKSLEGKIHQTAEKIRDIDRELRNMKKIETRISDIEGMFETIDRKLKAFQVPENIKKWFDSSVRSLNKSIGSEISKIHENQARNSDELSLLRNKFEDEASAIGKHLEELKAQDSRLESRIQETTKEVDSEMDSMHEKFVNNSDQLSALKNRMEEEIDVFDKVTEELRMRNSRLEDKIESIKDYFEDNTNRLREMISKAQKQMQTELESLIHEENSRNMVNLKKEIDSRPKTESEEIKYILRDLDSLKSEVQEQIKKLASHESILKNTESNINLMVESALEKNIERGIQSARSRLMESVKRDLRKDLIERDELESMLNSLNSARTEAENELEKLKRSRTDFLEAESRIKSGLVTHFDNMIKNSTQKNMENMRKDILREVKTIQEEELKKIRAQGQELKRMLEGLKSEVSSNSEKLINKKTEDKKEELRQEIRSEITSLEKRLSANADDTDILNQKLRDLEMSVSKLSKAPEEIRNEMAKFRQEVTMYLNDLAHNYDSKFRSVKQEVESRLKK